MAFMLCAWKKKSNTKTFVNTIESQSQFTPGLEAPRTRRISIVKEFALNTSTHALPGIARSQCWSNRLFWSISFITFASVMVYFVTSSILNYFSYPTQTSVTLRIDGMQPFPAVTICNYSPVRSDTTLNDYFNHINQTRAVNPSDMLLLNQYLIDQTNMNQSMDHYFFTLDNILIDCHYNGMKCKYSDFISFISATYGRCFTFNAKRVNTSETPLFITYENGGRGKLQLRLYAHNHLYIPYLTSDVSGGMVAMIHDNTELPLIELAGIEISPGKKHKLSYTRKKSSFLPTPYSDCTESIPLAMKAMFSSYENADYSYSQDVCYLICKQSYTYAVCGCGNPNEWATRSVVLPGTDKIVVAPLCNATDPCYINSFVEMSNNQSIWDEYCSECKQSCSSTDFVITTSSVTAPATWYYSEIKEFVENASVPLPANWTSNWVNEIHENYIGLDIVCESNVIEEFTETASISPIDIFSNIGGQTGLWIGISLLSIMEFIEMIFRLLRHELSLILSRIYG